MRSDDILLDFSLQLPISHKTTRLIWLAVTFEGRHSEVTLSFTVTQLHDVIRLAAFFFPKKHFGFREISVLKLLKWYELQSWIAKSDMNCSCKIKWCREIPLKLRYALLCWVAEVSSTWTCESPPPNLLCQKKDGQSGAIFASQYAWIC